MVSETFHVLPPIAARILDSDPEELSVRCLELLQYADAKRVFDTNDKKAIRGASGAFMKEVEDIDFELVEEQLAAERDS